MSSVLLYLAIVVMWLCVLVPMWLRRDKTNLAELAELEEYYTGEHQLPDLERLEAQEGAASGASSGISLGTSLGASLGASFTPPPGVVEGERVDPRQFRAKRRAIIVARRRRLLFFTGLLVIASVVTAAVKMMPWWGVAPSVVIALSYMGFLRIAVQVDRERRERADRARAERARRLREQRERAARMVAEQERAEIIDLSARQEDVLFDQYAEPPRRAVGD
ncbi:divisome protein SepX/GlpR [Nonomuraea rhodomycinica]|uniref:Transmembrane protein n=1 Tax=Nonomuraea rhodomycinica TaxID=1712872 RepID=A0A7Y6IT22_9ACTN|nr:hypothetical protein [Nonomuraea rhodomycinica]NUW43328.1 hypothetical protein [Nonomuraea rhodomycinica]